MTSPAPDTSNTAGGLSTLVLSAFERLPGEIRNWIYTYLLSPALNTHRERDFSHVYNRVKIHHEILLANKKIYREAHALMHGTLGPLLFVKGVSYNNVLLNLMSGLEFRPIYALCEHERVPGKIATLNFQWKDKAVMGSDILRQVYPGQPNIILYGIDQIEYFARWLKVLKIRDEHRQLVFSLSFAFEQPKNVFGETFMQESFLQKMQINLLSPFETFRGRDILHEASESSGQKHLQRYLGIANDPILWHRSEALGLVELFSSISKHRSPAEPPSTTDLLRKYEMLEVYIQNSHQSYSWIYGSDITIKDLEPMHCLFRAYSIIKYNKCLHLCRLAFENKVPSNYSLGEVLPLLCDSLKELYEGKITTSDVVPAVLNILTDQQLSLVYQLQATALLVLDGRTEYLDEARGFLEQSLALADGNESRVSTLKTCLENLSPLVLIGQLPTDSMKINVTNQAPSNMVAREWAFLQKCGYKGDFLHDRFLDTSSEETEPGISMTEIPPEVLEDPERDIKFWVGSGLCKGGVLMIGSCTRFEPN